MPNSSAVPQLNSLSDTKEAFPSIDVLRKYESLRVPGFYLGTADPASQESFCPGGAGKESRGTKRL